MFFVKLDVSYTIVFQVFQTSLDVIVYILYHLSVACKIIKPYCTGIPIRLIGGSSYNEGRVEVYYNNQWGTVCDDGWDDTDAGVVCRQLGFGSSGIAIGSAGFGQGSSSVWLSNVACTGSESILPSCGHLGVGVSSCTHSEDAGVVCNRTGAENGKIICIM